MISTTLCSDYNTCTTKCQTKAWTNCTLKYFVCRFEQVFLWMKPRNSNKTHTAMYASRFSQPYRRMNLNKMKSHFFHQYGACTENTNGTQVIIIWKASMCDVKCRNSKRQSPSDNVVTWPIMIILTRDHKRRRNTITSQWNHISPDRCTSPLFVIFILRLCKYMF